MWDWTPGIIEQWIAEVRPAFGRADNPALWPSERADRVALSALNARFATYRDAIGLDRNLDFHSLRRSYVTHLIEAGYDARFVQVLFSPPEGVHDVQHEAGTGRDLRGGGGYLQPSITRMTRRSHACAAGVDARLVA